MNSRVVFSYLLPPSLAMVPNSQKLLLVAVLYAATLGAIFLLHAGAGGQYYYST